MNNQNQNNRMNTIYDHQDADLRRCNQMLTNSKRQRDYKAVHKLMNERFILPEKVSKATLEILARAVEKAETKTAASYWCFDTQSYRDFLSQHNLTNQEFEEMARAD